MRLNEALIKDSEENFLQQKIPQQQRKLTQDNQRDEQLPPRRKRQILDRLNDAVRDPQLARSTFERILAGNDLTGINYLALGVHAARAVGRVHLRDSAGHTLGYGTGFLVAPGVLMTNNHVIGSDLAAETTLVEFDYELDIGGKDRPVASFPIDTSQGFITSRKLDFTLVGVGEVSIAQSQKLAAFGWLTLRPRPGKSFEGEYLTIIQHPGGERKQVCVRENKLLKYATDTLWYQTDTTAGSSGAPVFNGFWEVVALHHSGVPDRDKQGRYKAIDGGPWDPSMGESRIKWIANEGIRISRIVEFLRTAHDDDKLARRVLDAPESALAEFAFSGSDADALKAGSPSSDWSQGKVENGRLTVTLPVKLSLQLADLPSFLDATNAKAGPAPAPTEAGGELGIEAVVVDQSNYAQRNGFDPDFLGGRGLKVPLPRLSAKLARQAAKLTQGVRGDPHLLRYYNYSVVLNGRRRLAFFSAVNIDGAERRDSGKREGDRWYVDTRVPESAQVGEDFYASVKLDEAKRSRVFDRGHLVRRLDATWGETKALAKRNGDDTFHFTNCSPQHFSFNQGRKLWAGIEDYVLFEAENADRRICVINGPVFRNNDEERAGVKIPQQYFKIVALAKGGRLVTAGFLLSQAALLQRDLPAAEALRPISDEDAGVFQVKISKLERLTGLDFGSVTDHDAGMGAFEARVAARAIVSLDEIMV